MSHPTGVVSIKQVDIGVAPPGTKIFAEPQTITGSIGVIGASLVERCNVPDKYECLTITVEEKLPQFTDRSSSEDQKIIGEVSMRFIDFLERSRRGRTKEQIHQLAQGRVYTGRGLELGLVDHIGGVMKHSGC